MSSGKTPSALAARHVSFGWWSLLAFLCLVIGLETLHALKLAWYLAPGSEVRRLLLTLAHAHGALLAMLHLVFGLLLGSTGQVDAARLGQASRCLLATSLLLPGGFLFGGLWIQDGDPGLPVLLVPVGAVTLVFGVFQCARGFRGGGA